MKILEYDDVDPISVLNLNLLARDFALTPEYAARLRRTDPRLLPCLALYAVQNNVLAGQGGLFRLPATSIDGPEDIGGLWAVSIYPGYKARRVISRLLREAHTRMAQAGLRFSAVETDRFQLGYQLYQEHGYEDMHVHATALADWETAHQPTRLQAVPMGTDGFNFLDHWFSKVSSQYLGFTRRLASPASLRQRVSPEDLWMLRENDIPTGYALVHRREGLLFISDLLLWEGFDTAEAVAAIVARLRIAHLQVTVHRPAEIASLRRAGYQVVHPDRRAFMLKTLVPGASVEEARRQFGIGTDRFLVSWLDLP